MGRSARPVRAGAMPSYRSSHLCRAARGRARGRGDWEERTDGRRVHAMLVLPGLGCAGAVEAGTARRGRISPAFPRLPVHGGDLKDKGRGGSQPGRGAAPEFPDPNRQTCGSPRAARVSYTGIAVRAERPAWVDPALAPAPSRAKWPHPQRRRRLGAGVTPARHRPPAFPEVRQPR